MTASDQDIGTGMASNRKGERRCTPPLMPVVLRIPRIVEELPVLRSLPTRRYEIRGRVGIGAAMLMLVAALPWLVRWHPSSDSVQEALVPANPVIEASDIEVLPPLYAIATSSPMVNMEKESGIAELVDGLVAPPPSGGPQ